MAGDAADDAFDAAFGEWERSLELEHDPDYEDWLRGGSKGLMPRRCRYCGTRMLFWSKVMRPDGTEGWRLADAKGDLHTCEDYRIAKEMEAEEAAWDREIGWDGINE